MMMPSIKRKYNSRTSRITAKSSTERRERIKLMKENLKFEENLGSEEKICPRR